MESDHFLIFYCLFLIYNAHGYVNTNNGENGEERIFLQKKQVQDLPKDWSLFEKNHSH